MIIVYLICMGMEVPEWIVDLFIWLIYSGILIGGAVAVFRKMYRSRPDLEMTLKWNLPPIDPREHIDNATWFRANPKWEPDRYYNILKLESPDKTDWFEPFDTVWRCFYISYGDQHRLYRRWFTKNKLETMIAKEDVEKIGAWFIKNPPPKKIWIIFYFKDDYKLREWCYCKRFEYVGKRLSYRWNVYRNQIRNQLTGFKLTREPEECKNCRFKKMWSRKKKEKPTWPFKRNVP
jgi:hypothetical protein